MERKTRISILISGQGSNLQALIDAQTTTLKDSIIVRVGSNRKAAFGLVRAEERKIPTFYHNLVDYKKRYPDSIDQARSEYDRDLAIKLLEDKPDIIVCAGFLHILAPTFLHLMAAASVPVINLQHYVISEVDMGEPILVTPIPFFKDEDIEKLKDRVHGKEHEAIVAGTKIAISRLKERSSLFTNQAA
ncbi:MAG: hypothetical protein ASARMPREDX12_000490 [Alectoria sarmentosa]|nr:MAG: hypothetical protein ASARMPREDX12_000490 [Alectoria sarmentosa]